MFRMHLAAAALAASSMQALALAAPPVAVLPSAGVTSPARKRISNGPGWFAPRYRRSRGAQAHRKRRTNRNHISRRTRRKHRRAA